MKGDQIMIRGKKRKETVCVAFTCEDETARDD